MECTVCGGASFGSAKILWSELIAEWQLAPEEVDYIDQQQGTSCLACGANLRTIVLANAILSGFNSHLTFANFILTPEAEDLAILEINEAGGLSPTLQGCRGHVLAKYPDVDIHSLPYPDGTFDLVVHSDTLEHVAQPVRALSECRRVLKASGLLCFTIPTVVGRLTRSREGLAPSYHGAPGMAAADYTVRTEFGADAWTYVLRAGFHTVQIHSVKFPCATALSARS